ncbi:MAG: glyoxalase [Planctomycetes bacterium]|nr:glyoxalase [Planctomycetota bacterium]
MQINMVSLSTDRLEAMKAFYTSVLGFEVVEDLGSYVEFGGQPVRFAMCERKIMQQATGDASFDQQATGSPFELAFECATCEELDKRYAELISQGAKPVKGPSVMPWNQYAAFFADPDGYVHELFARLEEAG